jgi:hypothetical protein
MASSTSKVGEMPVSASAKKSKQPEALTRRDGAAEDQSHSHSHSYSHSQSQLQGRKQRSARKRGLPRPRRALPASPSLSAQRDIVSATEWKSHGELEQLRYYAELLQKLHVRHKNQHRGQVWFRSINQLRRSLRSLLETESELGLLRGGTSDTVVGRGAEGEGLSQAAVVRRRLEKEKELELRRDELRVRVRGLVPVCYLRCSALIADGEGGFAGLGVVLVGIVAGVGGVVGFEEGEDGDGRGGGMEGHSGRKGVEIDERRSSGVGGDGVGVSEMGKVGGVPGETGKGGAYGVLVVGVDEEGDDDMGVAVVREEKGVSKTSPIPAPRLSASKASTAESSSKKEKHKTKPKEKKRKKNAIDDLFSGF